MGDYRGGAGAPTTDKLATVPMCLTPQTELTEIRSEKTYPGVRYERTGPQARATSFDAYNTPHTPQARGDGSSQ